MKTMTVKLRIEAPGLVQMNHICGARLLSQRVIVVLFYSKVINQCVPVPVFCFFSQCTKTLKQHPYVAAIPVAYARL